MNYSTDGASDRVCGMLQIGHRPLTAIDLFSGCGGATLGFKAAGFRVTGAVEIDPMAAGTYQRNHPEVMMAQTDIDKLDPVEFCRGAGLEPGQCTVVIGCPPCQGFSSHRMGKGTADDPRNRFVFVYANWVMRIRPTCFVFENVAGLARDQAGTWVRAKALLSEAGYRITEGILDAADYGVAQRRKRFLAVGILSDMGMTSLPATTHAKKPGNQSVRPWATVRQRWAGLGSPVSTHSGSLDDPLHVAPNHDAPSVRRFSMIPRDGGSRSSLPSELQLECHVGHDGHKDVYGRLSWDKPSSTITGGCTQPSKGRFLHPDENRGLSLREVARIQGFPDNYAFKGSKHQVALQLGNAVPPQLAYAIGLAVVRTVSAGHGQGELPLPVETKR